MPESKPNWRKGRFLENVKPIAYRNRARTAWKDAHGDIPDGFHVHHKDGDFRNNNLENLELVDAWLHNSVHHRGPLYHIPGHMRPLARARRAEYQREYFKRPGKRARRTALNRLALQKKRFISSIAGWLS